MRARKVDSRRGGSAYFQKIISRLACDRGCAVPRWMTRPRVIFALTEAARRRLRPTNCHRHRVLPVEIPFQQAATSPELRTFLEAIRSHGSGLKCAAESRGDPSQRPSPRPPAPDCHQLFEVQINVVLFNNAAHAARKSHELPGRIAFSYHRVGDPRRHDADRGWTAGERGFDGFDWVP
jgi:hypothetical protein